MAEFDKFYTKKKIAKKCVRKLHSILKIKSNAIFLEPTAGNGAFLNYLDRYKAYDIKPEDDRIKKKNIFKLVPKRDDYITIGNPPFGKRSKLAIRVFNKVAEYSDVIAFILPISFLKYNAQKHLDKNFKLVYNYLLPKNSFLDRGNTYDINCVFQIYVRNKSKFDKKLKDLRIYKRPSIKSKDLKIWQYNATKSSFKVVKENWKFAVYRQGYKDYSKLFTQKDKKKKL